MATKMIGFRLSGDHLEKAQEILGSDITGINKKARELMIAFLAGKITITEPDMEPVETLPPDLISDLTDKIRELQEQINQNNKETTDRLNDLENKITTANNANTVNSLNIVPNTADQETTDSNINLTASTASTTLISHTANTANSANTVNSLNIVPNTADQETTDSNINLTANTANSPNTTEKYYRGKLLERLNLKNKASKNQIVPKLKKLGVRVDPNSENFYQESFNLLDQTQRIHYLSLSC